MSGCVNCHFKDGLMFHHRWERSESDQDWERPVIIGGFFFFLILDLFVPF